MNDKQIMLTKQIMLIEDNPDDRDLGPAGRAGGSGGRDRARRSHRA